jgi:NADPH:quinone reductase
MKAIVFDKIGSPLEVLHIADVRIPEIGDDEVLVKMTAASINPGDFLFIQNLYPDPKKPHFPEQIAGNHGAGIIAKVGKEVSLKPGTLVAFSYNNTWAEYAAVPAEWLIPLPSDYPVEKAAQLVNPITAWDLLSESRVQAGQWLAVTAGNSTVATMVLQFAKYKKIKCDFPRETHEQRSESLVAPRQ